MPAVMPTTRFNAMYAINRLSNMVKYLLNKMSIAQE